MKRLLKWLFLIFVLPPLVLFLVLWAVVEFTPQEKFRAIAARELGSRIGRQVEIGPVHLGWSGLGIDALRLSEIPNFKAGTFFSAKGIRLGWGLKSLWDGLDIKKKFVTRSSGHFQIDEFQNPNYKAKDFSLRWSLSDMDPTWSHLNGWAKLEQGAGLLQNVDQLMATAPSAKIALAPVLALMSLERLGFLKLGLPDLRHWPIQGIHGNYTFKNGHMTIDPFRIDSPQLGMGTMGTIDLGSGSLLLDVQVHSPKIGRSGALDAKLGITGTLSKPKVDLSSLKKKAFEATLNNILENPEGAKKGVDETLKKIFH